MSTSVPDDQPISDGIRETVEYQTAWDLELWKAEEKRKFELQLERERKQYGKRLEEEGARRERERNEEFSQNKAAVAKLMAMLKRNIEDMAKREESLTAKEGELNRRKSQLAIDQEKKIREFENQLRNNKEERFFDTEALNSRIRELETENSLLKDRIHKSQEDFNTVCEEFSAYKREHLLETSKENSKDCKMQLQLQEVTKSRDELLTKYEKASASSSKYKTQLKKLVTDYNSLIELTHRRQMDSFEQERTAMRRNQILQETAAIRRMNVELNMLEGKKCPTTATTAMMPSAGSEELRWLIGQAEKSELNNISIEIKPTKESRKKRRTKKKPPSDHTSDHELDPDSGHEYPPVDVNPVMDEPSGITDMVIPLDASPLSLLKREIQNRERLITTGVMTPDDDYIKQVSQSIATKCLELNVSEADLI
eukprot:TRINITY_DN34643_c0_g1_i1.p1 TRINITY_DN34643_c0_g1~~TRINITY_DN34643_c0_g1_i1.p1  ORF type:complete len:426 (+),score=114.47 TRINITY_DN34643_c0_g1_i1:50-1327(+)